MTGRAGVAVAALAAVAIGAAAIGVAWALGAGRSDVERGTATAANDAAVTLAASTSGGGPPPVAVLERTAGLLRARLVDAGIPTATAVVSGQTIVVTVPTDKVDQVKQASAPAELRIRPLRLEPFPSTSAAPGGDPTQQYPGATPADAARLAALDCASTRGAGPDKPGDVIAACAQDRTSKLLLGPAIIEGSAIRAATAVLDQSFGGWQILLDFTSAGQASWTDYTSKHNVAVTPGDVGNKVAFVLDGKVVSYPEIQNTITGSTTITGDFGQTSATTLANALRHGALPVQLTVQQVEQIN